MNFLEFYSFITNGNEWKNCKVNNLTMFKTMSKMSTTTCVQLFKFLNKKKHVKVTDFTLTKF